MLNAINLHKVADKLARLSVLHNRAAWKLYTAPKSYDLKKEQEIITKSARCDAGAQMLTRMAYDN
jgi:hypothetical protein